MEESRETALQSDLPWPAVMSDYSHHRVRSGPPAIMSVAVGSITLTLSPRGAVNGEWFLEHLPPALAAAEHRELRVDLSRALELDNLALSALVVMLRNYASGFQKMDISGLPPWAAARIEDTGARNLLGRHWQGQFGEKEVSFQRC